MMLPEILVSVALLLLAAAGWLGTRREGFHVDSEPPRRNLIIHRSFHFLAGLLSAAACYWVGSTGAVAQEGELLLHTSIAGSLLPLFFLWMSLAGMLSFVLSCAEKDTRQPADDSGVPATSNPIAGVYALTEVTCAGKADRMAPTRGFVTTANIHATQPAATDHVQGNTG